MTNKCSHFLISDAFVVDVTRNDTGSSLWQTRGFSGYWQHRFSARQNQGRILFLKNIVTGMTTSITRELRDLAEPKPKGVYHDAWYIYYGSLVGLKGGIIPNKLVEYRQHIEQQYGAMRNSQIKGVKDKVYMMPEIINRNLRILNPLIQNVTQQDIKDKYVLNFVLRKRDHFSSRKVIYSDVNVFKKIIYIFSETWKLNYLRYSNLNTWLLDIVSLKYIFNSNES